MTDSLLLIAGLGTPEMIAILIVVLLIFGPTQLPKIGRALGGGIKEFRDGLKTGMDEGGEPTTSSPPPRTTVAALPSDSASPAEPAAPAEKPQETPRL